MLTHLRFFVRRRQNIFGALEQSEGQSAPESVVLPVQAAIDHGAKSGPHRLPPVSNPFDPDLFNRRFHAAKSD